VRLAPVLVAIGAVNNRPACVKVADGEQGRERAAVVTTTNGGYLKKRFCGPQSRLFSFQGGSSRHSYQSNASDSLHLEPKRNTTPAEKRMLF